MTKFHIVPIESILPEGDSNGLIFSRSKFDELFKDSPIVIISLELEDKDLKLIQQRIAQEDLSVSVINLKYPATGDLGDIVNLFEDVRREIPSIASIVIAGALGRVGELFLERFIKYVRGRFSKNREVKVDRRKLHKSGYTYDQCNFYINVDLDDDTLKNALREIEHTYAKKGDCTNLIYDKDKSKWIEP